MNHYASVRKPNKKAAPEVIEEQDKEQEVTGEESQFVKPEITEEEIRKGLENHKQQHQARPQNLANQDLDSLLQIKKGDVSYAEKTREEVRQRKQKARELTERELLNQMKKPSNDQFIESLEDIVHNKNQRMKKRDETDLEKDPFRVEETYVDPAHVAGKQKDGEKIIFMPFPTQEPVLKDLNENKPNNEGEKKKKKKKKKDAQIDPNVPQNVLADLEYVNDNGLPERTVNVPNYHIQNTPYNIFPGEENQQRGDNRKQTTNPNAYQRPVKEQKQNPVDPKTGKPIANNKNKDEELNENRKSKMCNIF